MSQQGHPPFPEYVFFNKLIINLFICLFIYLFIYLYIYFFLLLLFFFFFFNHLFYFFTETKICLHFQKLQLECCGFDNNWFTIKVNNAKLSPCSIEATDHFLERL